MNIESVAYSSFTRYLAAKQSVDDRALNQQVWQILQRAIQERTDGHTTPLHVVEIGAGIGTMVERLFRHDFLSRVDYTLVDAEAENIQTAQTRLAQWARAEGFAVSATGNGAALQRKRAAQTGLGSVQANLHFHTADCFAFATEPDQQQRYDLLIAHAFLDLVDSKQALSKLQRLLRPQALLYLTINFDGATILQPVIDPIFDAQIEALYHATMDERMVNGQPSGDSQTGRHLFGHLRAAGVDILAAGSSDWVVFAGPQGYPADEAYFLHFIVNTIAGALQDHPALDQLRFHDWIQQRHAQIERGELVYIAHQLDFLGRLTAQAVGE